MERWHWILIALLIGCTILCSIVARLDRRPGGSLRLIGVELVLLVAVILHWWLGLTAPLGLTEAMQRLAQSMGLTR